jgi:hypothetical protein
VDAKEPFAQLLQPARAAQQVADQLRQDDQAAVRPARALHDQRAKVGRRRAVREALRVVVEAPSLVDQVDRRLGVLDHGAVLDVAAHLSAVLVDDDGDVVERGVAQERIGADPERCVVLREALVDQVLDVGRRAGGALEHHRRVGNCAVRRLRDGDALVARRRHDGDESKRIVGQQQAVGVERDQERRHGNLERRFAVGLDQMDPVAMRLDVEALSEQRDVRIEVHRLVRLVRQVREALALEARQRDGEQRRESRVFVAQGCAVERRGGVVGAAQPRLAALAMRARRAHAARARRRSDRCGRGIPRASPRR